MRKIAVVNQKGGCGKTTTAINLAACLSQNGKKVLAVDMDPQGNLTGGFNIDRDRLDASLYDVLTTKDPLALRSILREVNENLSVAPCNVLLSALEQELAGVDGREERLAQALAPVADNYDFILIDSSPYMGLLTFNVLLAADEAIVPVDPNFNSLHGMGKLFEMMNLLREKKNHQIAYKVLATMYDSRTKISQAILSEIRSRFDKNAFQTVIRNTIKIKEASGLGVPITDFRGSRGYEDYTALTHEILTGKTTQSDLSDLPPLENFLAPRRVGSGGVLFSFYGPKAQQVYLAGDFNNWSSTEDFMYDADGNGLWQRVIPLKGGKHRYKFVIDGEYLTDPNNPNEESDEIGTPYSVIEL